VADDEWSSLVVLPSGSVLNAQVVANATGVHDRVISVDHRAGTVTLQLLDGWQGGDRYYYHLVTDSSDPVAATIELGVYAPRLANLPPSARASPTTTRPCWASPRPRTDRPEPATPTGRGSTARSWTTTATR
jgi:hypothetical protein